MKKILFLLAATFLAAASAQAARPFVTDDARLTTAGSCQLESWTRIYPQSHEVWALPACNPGGNFEVTLGAGQARVDGLESTRDYVLQAKTLFKPLVSNGWGIGLGAGTVRHPEITPGPNLLGNTYAYVPMSFSFNDDQLIMHVNMGWLRDRALQRDNMTWGVGSEFQINDRLLGIAEVFGDNRVKPYWQSGVRYSIVPNLLQVDMTIGQQFEGAASGRWISVGMRFTPDKLF